MLQRQRLRVWCALAFTAGLLLRVFFVLHHPRWGGDTLVYGDLAENMLTRHVFGFSGDTVVPTLIRLPGYPAFLAACFLLFGHANYLAVVCVQVAIDLCGCALLAVLSARLWGTRAGMACLWLAVLCPFTANYCAAALTETWSLFCVALAFFAMERVLHRWQRSQPTIGWSLVLGASLSYAVLVRPDQGLLAAVIIPALLWCTLRTPQRSLLQRLAPPLVASLVVAVPLLLWGVRNWRDFHVIQPLAPRQANDPGEYVPYGFQRWYRTWGVDYKSTFDVYWNYDGAAIDIQTLPPRAFDSTTQRAETAALLNAYNQQQSGTPAFDQAFGRIAEARIAAQPLRYWIEMPVARELDMWLRPRTEFFRLPLDWWNFGAHPGASIFELLYGLLDAAYLALGLIGFVRWSRLRWSGLAPLSFAMAAFVFLRCALLLTLDNSEPRYTLECFPVVILCATLAFFRPASSSELSSWGVAEGPAFRKQQHAHRLIVCVFLSVFIANFALSIVPFTRICEYVAVR